MTSDDKEQQRARHLRGAGREDQRRANQKARKQRRDDAERPAGAPPRRGNRRVEDWLEDDGQEVFERIVRTRRSAPGTPSDATRPTGPGFRGIVVARHRDAFEATLDRRVEAGDTKALRVAMRHGDLEPTVGDAIELAIDAADGSWRLAEILPRRSLLERPDPGDPRRRLPVAANVDVVVSVQSAERPRPGLTDRIALASTRAGASLLVCLNKLDLAGPANADAIASLREIAARLSAPFVAVSATTGEGLPELRLALRGSCAVFVGPSGVGKSSICNALDPDVDLRVGAVRDTDRRGRHTTTSSSLHRLAGEITLIDTPGVRAFGLGAVTDEELAGAFPDVAAEARSCRFRDCAHGDEPGCTVSRAVSDGRLAAARVEAWRRVRRADD